MHTVSVVLSLAVLTTACEPPSKTDPASTNSAPRSVKTVKPEIPDSWMSLKSSAFEQGKPIPRKYTCEGRNVSPPLEWDQVPPQTKSFALLVEDPDAPDPAAPKMVWNHWTLFGLAGDMTSLAEGVRLNRDAHVAWNDYRHRKYEGPCPPKGNHRYFFKLYALDIAVEDLVKPDKNTVKQKMKGHFLGKAELMGTYEKKGAK